MDIHTLNNPKQVSNGRRFNTFWATLWEPYNTFVTLRAFEMCSRAWNVKQNLLIKCVRNVLILHYFYVLTLCWERTPMYLYMLRNSVRHPRPNNIAAQPDAICNTRYVFCTNLTLWLPDGVYLRHKWDWSSSVLDFGVCKAVIVIHGDVMAWERLPHRWPRRSDGNPSHTKGQ